MSKSKRTLPEFNSPPVFETVLAVQFNPIQGLSIGHHGLFWSTIRSDFPKYISKSTLDPATEKFGAEVKPTPKFRLQVMDTPDIRSWFTNEPETRLVQVQQDRFIFNWKKVKGTEEYPRYDTLKPEFQKVWKKFNEFLIGEGFAVPEINQCEVTYVNHIEIGTGWKSYGDTHKVISILSGKLGGAFLNEPESINLKTSYLMPDKKGRLHISVQPAIRKYDTKEIIQVSLTARGEPNSSNTKDILSCFDLGREWIVRGFTDFTTKEMHKTWGRTL